MEVEGIRHGVPRHIKSDLASKIEKGDWGVCVLCRPRRAGRDARPKRFRISVQAPFDQCLPLPIPWFKNWFQAINDPSSPDYAMNQIPMAIVEIGGRES